MLTWLLFGFFMGSAVAAVAYTVSVIIKRSNIGDFIKQAIRNAQTDVAKKAIGRVIRVKVKNKTINSVSIETIDKETGNAFEVEITSSQGVDSSVRVGELLTVNG